MILFIILMLVLALVWVAVATFVGTAQVVLPWTISAALMGFGAAMVIAALGSSNPKLAPVVRLSAFGLTLLFGYMLCLANPPTPGPISQRDPQRELMENLVVPRIRPTQEDIWQMLPVHLGIAGGCAM